MIYRKRIFNQILQIFVINSQKYLYNYLIIILIFFFILYYICTTTSATIVRYERTLPCDTFYLRYPSYRSITNYSCPVHTYTAYLLIRLYSHTQVYVRAIIIARFNRPKRKSSKI